MDYEFDSQEDLYKRVKPALNAKLNEFKRLGYKDVYIKDIWNYLIVRVWPFSKNLMLCDIVSDILYTNCSDIYAYKLNYNLNNHS